MSLTIYSTPLCNGRAYCRCASWYANVWSDRADEKWLNSYRNCPIELLFKFAAAITGSEYNCVKAATNRNGLKVENRRYLFFCCFYLLQFQNATSWIALNDAILVRQRLCFESIFTELSGVVSITRMLFFFHFLITLRWIVLIYMGL